MHAYPHCWRCDTPLIFRVADDWLIAVDGVRQQLLDENAKVEWTPAQYGKRMDDWLRNMEDWNISRRRYYGLPLPFYPCTCGHLNVIGSRAELEARAVSGLEQLQELHRPWIDEVVITCEHCGNHLRRIPEVGDVWLDAGIVPFSTLGWQNDAFVPEGYATGAAKGLTKADLPDHAYWEQWFPADWVTEMREQIRLWFYSLLFMSVVLTGRSPFRKVLTYEKLLDAEGREMHGSWGNLISADEAFERMGADVMRWLYCQQPPTQNIRFGYGPADEVKRRLLTLWNSARFFVDYAAIEGFEPRYEDLTDGRHRRRARPLDAWLLARTNQLIADAEAAYEAYLTVDVIDAFEAFLEDLSNWYIRRSRRRFYSFDEAAFRTLWTALVQALRVIAPVLPFLSERLWQTLVTGACPDAPASVHLAGWPTRASARGTRSCSRRSPRCATSSSSAAARAARPTSSSASRCAASTCAARARPRGTPTRSPRSCASRRSASTRAPSPACRCCRTCACSGRGSAPSCPRCAPRSSTATSSSSTTAGCARPARCSSPTR